MLEVSDVGKYLSDTDFVCWNNPIQEPEPAFTQPEAAPEAEETPSGKALLRGTNSKTLIFLFMHSFSSHFD